MSAGKGDKPRPVDGGKFRSNWDAIFKKQPQPNPFEDHRPKRRVGRPKKGV